MAENDPISARECNKNHETLNEWVKSLSVRIDKMEGKLWLIITLLFGNLAALATLISQKH